MLDIASTLLQNFPGAAAHIHAKEYGTPIQTLAYSAPFENLVRSDYAQFISLLIENKVDINEKKHIDPSVYPDCIGLGQALSPIQRSVFNFNWNCMRALIDLDADVSIKVLSECGDSWNLYDLAFSKKTISHTEWSLKSKMLNLLRPYFQDSHNN